MPVNNFRVLITGGGGYLGSVLTPLLIEKGYSVTVVDRFFWGQNVLQPHQNLSLITADTRSLTKHHFANIDVVIDLAALSNDPIAELAPQKTLDINYHARAATAALAKQAGVKKYILASSCSVYGFNEDIVTETSIPAPVTTYAKASLLAEEAVLSLADTNFCVTALRQGTLYGLSPRMRFDVVLNTMTLSLFKENLITIEGGKQWRPILHVADSAGIFVNIVSTEPGKINGHIFNAGSENQNYQIENLGKEIIAAINPAAKLIISNTKQDMRSYRVSFQKLQNTLGYSFLYNPVSGAKQVHESLVAKKVADSKETRTIDWYKHLLNQNPAILEAT